MPEHAYVSAAITGNFSEAAAAREELVARSDHAELVSTGVGQHDVVLIWKLPHVEVPGAEAQGDLDRLLLIFTARAGEVEVHAVGAGLVRESCDEAESHLRVVTRQQGACALLDDLPTEQTAPKRCQTRRIVGVERDCYES